jgi:hypothetical protein
MSRRDKSTVASSIPTRLPRVCRLLLVIRPALLTKSFSSTPTAIKLTTVGPKERVPMLRHGLGRIQPATSTPDSALGQWHVNIKREPIDIQARELQPPTIVYKRSVAAPLIRSFLPC